MNPEVHYLQYYATKDMTTTTERRKARLKEEAEGREEGHVLKQFKLCVCLRFIQASGCARPTPGNLGFRTYPLLGVSSHMDPTELARLVGGSCSEVFVNWKDKRSRQNAGREWDSNPQLPCA